MNIKRTLAVLLTAMFAIGPVACGDSDDGNENQSGGQGGSGGSGGTGGSGDGGSGGSGGGDGQKAIIELDADITDDTTLTADKIWLLKKQVFVKKIGRAHV